MRMDHGDGLRHGWSCQGQSVTLNRYLTHLLIYIFKYEMGQYVKKWSDGVLDTLQDEIKCAADCCERWQCLQRNTHGYGTSSVVCRH